MVSMITLRFIFFELSRHHFQDPFLHALCVPSFRLRVKDLGFIFAFVCPSPLSYKNVL